MHRTFRLALGVAGALFAMACGETAAPPAATTIVLSTSSVSFDAVGASQTVTATVKDQHGNPMPTAVVQWSQGTAIVGVAPNPVATVPTVNLIADANGSDVVTATSGKATATIAVSVKQVAASMQKISGDQQIGSVGVPVLVPAAVRVVDRLGTPVAGAQVTFAVTQGGGSVTGANQTTDATGVATAGSWTLGPSAGANELTATTTASGVQPVAFTAIGTTGPLATNIAIAANGNQAIMAGQPVTALPSVLVTNAAGTPVPGYAVTFAVTAGGGTITGASTVTNAAGIASPASWTIGATAALNTVTATAAGLTGSPVTLRVSGCEGGGAGYQITVCYRTSMTASQRQAFVDAAAHWGTIITSELTDINQPVAENACGAAANGTPGTPSLNMNIDDLLIFAAIDPIDGPNGILGSSGPCFVRNSNTLPVIGTMHFDIADVANLETSNQFRSVILHEMGHVIGIGSLWNTFHFLQSPSTASSQLDTFFSGTNAIAAFNTIGGSTYTGGQKVPVENTGGSGTINVHWRESVLQNELMTGFLNQGANPLSVLTVQSLVDLGYTVNAGAADPFSLTLTLRAQVSPFDGEMPGVSLQNDAYTGPLWSIDEHGKKTRLR